MSSVVSRLHRKQSQQHDASWQLDFRMARMPSASAAKKEELITSMPVSVSIMLLAAPCL